MSSQPGHVSRQPLPREQEPQSVEQLLGLVSGKLDMLLAAATLTEHAVDARWRESSGASAERPGAVAKPSRQTSRGSKDAEEFMALRQHRDAFKQALGGAQPDTAWTLDLEMRAAADLDPLHDRLYVLAQQLVSAAATGDADLKFKALAIQEFAEEKSDDIVHRLAASLAADILARL